MIDSQCYLLALANLRRARELVNAARYTPNEHDAGQVCVAAVAKVELYRAELCVTNMFDNFLSDYGGA
jgi:hypothetical protein